MALQIDGSRATVVVAQVPVSDDNAVKSLCVMVQLSCLLQPKEKARAHKVLIIVTTSFSVVLEAVINPYV